MEKDPKQTHQQLKHLLLKFDSDLSAEAKNFQPTLTRIHNLIPQLPKDTDKVVLEFKDGKQIEIPIIKSVTGEQFLDIRTLYPHHSLLIFDPGYTKTASCASSISYSNKEGHLLYRGYKIEELAQNSNYIEVCHLLLYGQLPNQQELDNFSNKIKNEMYIHEKLLSFYKGFSVNAHPMSIMCSIVGALSSFIHHTLDIRDPLQRELSAIKLIAKMPILAAISFRTSAGLPIVYPKRKLSYIENFMYMMFSDPTDPEFKVPQILIDYMEKVFILHADNDQCPSTTSVRIAASSLANPFAAIAAGIASLWGASPWGSK